MKKTAVIYESKYGFTKRYAEWIAQALSCPLFERKHFKKKDFSDYEVILYGGGLYASGISGIQFLNKNWKLLSNKKIILFTCGLADPKNPDNVSNIRKSLAKVLSGEQRKNLKIFHLRGGIDYSRLNVIHKAMMAMLRRMLLKKGMENLGVEERMLLDTYGKCIDFTDRNSIKPLVLDLVSGHNDAG